MGELREEGRRKKRGGREDGETKDHMKQNLKNKKNFLNLFLVFVFCCVPLDFLLPPFSSLFYSFSHIFSFYL